MTRFGCTYKLNSRVQLSNGIYIDTYRHYFFGGMSNTYKKYLTDTINNRKYLWRVNDYTKTYAKRLDSNAYIIYKLDMRTKNYKEVMDSLFVDLIEFKKSKEWDWLYNPW